MDWPETLLGVLAEFGRVEQQRLLVRHLALTSIAREEELEGVSVQGWPVPAGGVSLAGCLLSGSPSLRSFRKSPSVPALVEALLEASGASVSVSEEGLSTGQAFAVAGPGSTGKRGT